jgi:FAD:protein FMN transferase
MTNKGHRRDFLKGKLAAESLADALQQAPPEDSSAGDLDLPGAGILLRVSRRAMACEFEVCLNAGQYERGAEAALDALDLVESLEEQLSFFRETSEISAVNRSAWLHGVEVEPRLFELLQMAMQVSQETQGAFDLTSTPLWELWGFSRRAGAIPPDDKIAEALKHVGSRLVELDPQRRAIRFREEGVKLNLGSVGKGFALDRCAEKLAAAGIGDCLLHGGYSSVLARGTPKSTGKSISGGLSQFSSDENGTVPLSGWTVGIRHPLRREERLAEVRLCNRALSTSGLAAQSFRHQGRRYGHILDPRTGRPAEGVLSATAIAPTASLAEALSTAFYVMGPQETLAYCRSRPEIAAVMICPAQQIGKTEIFTAGISENELILF